MANSKLPHSNSAALDTGLEPHERYEVAKLVKLLLRRIKDRLLPGVEPTDEQKLEVYAEAARTVALIFGKEVTADQVALVMAASREWDVSPERYRAALTREQHALVKAKAAEQGGHMKAVIGAALTAYFQG
ncbi:hypothetical protein [Paracraurococcus lichenis]|uniref:Uncharacterized protein n=1 Tax=Paracraurococcus lichenis TaxID=3064888 RepID=A0ABT9ECF2_9PROT|nr:hypothetical protein [Paracraurococcus sp. LOR1-02]MDO9713887.1 hypothetical protein [Paracraurococcus sp. LOR1-02]